MYRSLAVQYELEKYLTDLETRIDSEVENRLINQWISFSDGVCKQEVFRPSRPSPNPAAIAWPIISVNAAIDDYTTMALRQFSSCSSILNNAGGLLMCVRCDYGTGILPSLFGAEQFMMEEQLNTLPASKPLPGGIDNIKALLDKGIPDLRTALGGKVLEMGAYFTSLMEGFPKIKDHVYIYHPDLQGPMDICELLLGSDIFTGIYDHSDLIKDLLKLITETYILFMREWNKLVAPMVGYAVHWGMLHKGQVMLRNDSAMNFSPSMYKEFIRPFDQMIFDEFRGGAIHFCGRGNHYIESMSQMRSLYAINLSQPELNDMETIFKHTVDKGIKLLGLSRTVTDTVLGSGRNLGGQVQV